MRLVLPIAALLAAHAHCLQLPRAPPPRGRIAVSMAEAAPSTPPDQMRLKEIKEELDARGVKWRGVCFERADLVQAVLDARAAPASSCEPEPAAPASSCDPAPAASCDPAPAASCEPAQTARSDPDRAAPSAPVAPQADEDVYEAAYATALSRGRGLRVAELRAELAAAGIGWAGVTEKARQTWHACTAHHPAAPRPAHTRLIRAAAGRAHRALRRRARPCRPLLAIRRSHAGRCERSRRISAPC